MAHPPYYKKLWDFSFHTMGGVKSNDGTINIFTNEVCVNNKYNEEWTAVENVHQETGFVTKTSAEASQPEKEFNAFGDTPVS